MKRKRLAPGPCILSRAYENVHFNQILWNPLGLAAGFDKNGELVDVIHEYGFGFIEVGSVTRRGGKGNPKPRLFRCEDDGLLNRMGLNGDAAYEVAERLRFSTSNRYGVNIAKTHDPQILGDAAIRDIVACYDLLKFFGMYTAINISCPNTAEGKTFEEPGALRELLDELKLHSSGGSRPLMIKVSPSLSCGPMEKFHELIDICEEYHVAGYIVGNTMPTVHPQYGKGGKSGPALRGFALALITVLRPRTHGTIIACGGITDGMDLLSYQRAGASLFQVYTGFVVGRNAGVNFAHKLNRDFEPVWEPRGTVEF